MDDKTDYSTHQEILLVACVFGFVAAFAMIFVSDGFRTVENRTNLFQQGIRR